jgi:aromatic-L-amino-acid/L-tryptophan decarboxylase
VSSLALPPDVFRRLAAQVADLSVDYLSGADARSILPTLSAPEIVAMFDGPVPEVGIGDAVVEDLARLADGSRIGNGRLFSYIVTPGESVASLADLYASVLNQNVTAWRSAPAAVAVEHSVVRWLAEAVGCAGFQGSLTSGGSAANLMGLAMARESRRPANDDGASPAIVYASTEAHMSIPKTLALLGLGRRNLRLIPTDDRFRIDLGALERAIVEDEAKGRAAIAIVGSAGTTNTGAIDDLPGLAAIAAEHDLWLHADGAYGALAALAEPSKLEGLSLADSVSLDAHKWLYQPLDCSIVLFKDVNVARRTFSHSDDYVRPLSDDPIEGFAFFDQSVELSRRFRALKIWTSLRYHGLSAFREAIAADLRHARLLAELVDREPLLELLAPVELSAVCFRWNDGSEAASLDERNAAILRALNRRGRVSISNATIRGAFALRACIVNHLATDDDVVAIVDEVLAAASDVS